MSKRILMQMKGVILITLLTLVAPTLIIAIPTLAAQDVPMLVTAWKLLGILCVCYVTIGLAFSLLYSTNTQLWNRVFLARLINPETETIDTMVWKLVPNVAGWCFVAESFGRNIGKSKEIKRENNQQLRQLYGISDELYESIEKETDELDADVSVVHLVVGAVVLTFGLSTLAMLLHVAMNTELDANTITVAVIAVLSLRNLQNSRR